MNSGSATRVLLAILLAVTVGCAETRPEPMPRTASFLRAVASLAAADRDVIQVSIYEIPPGTKIEEVVLLGPKGERVSTRDFITSTSKSGPGVTRGPITFGFAYNARIPREDSRGGRPGVLSQRKLAFLTLPAQSRYRDAPTAWQIELRYRDQLGDPRILSVPPPLP